MNILDTIIAQKKTEVTERKRQTAVAELERKHFFSVPAFSLRSFLLDANKTGIIAEFKRKSPSKGMINDIASVEEVTAAYSQHGASGLSILTDRPFFGGSLDDLAAARIHPIPLLRKDFMIDEYQLIEAKAFGADVVLLIAACLTPAEVKRLAAAAKHLGLEVLLEIHQEEELEHLCDAVDMVGVNNRNLKTFDVCIDTSLQLIGKIPADTPAVAESGINDPGTILTLRKAGFKGFLIGEHFMKQASPPVAFADFTDQLKAAQHAY